jgi:hypothetical protein
MSSLPYALLICAAAADAEIIPPSFLAAATMRLTSSAMSLWISDGCAVISPLLPER